MSRRIAPNILIVLASCGRVGFDPTGDGGSGAEGGGPDAYVCDRALPFGAPVPIAELNTVGGVGEGTLRLLPDELTGYFWRRDTTDTMTLAQIFYASRLALDAPWTAQPVTGLDDGRGSLDPTLVSDGSLLVFRKTTPDDLYLAVPIDATSFQPPVEIGSLNSLSADTEPFLQASGSELIFNSLRSGGGDLYRATRSGKTFSAPTLIAEVSTTADEGDPVLSADGLELYFRSNRVGNEYDIYRATRASQTDTFGAAEVVPNVNTASEDGPSSLSLDGCRLYLTSKITGDFDLYVATRGL